MKNWMPLKVSPFKTALAARTDRPNWLINRNFALWSIGGAISGLGDAVYGTMLGLWFLQQILGHHSWAPLANSTLMVFAAIPGFLIGPWAGVFVDRWLHRRTMIITNAINALLMILLVFVTGSISLPWHLSPLFIVGFLCLESLLLSSCGQFGNPASTGLFQQIVPKRDLTRAQGLSQILSLPTVLIGSSLGTFLYFKVGMFWCLMLNTLSFVVWMVTLWAIRLHPVQVPEQKRAHKHFWPEFASGLRFSSGNRVIRTFILLTLILSLGGAVLSPIESLFLRDNLHTDLSNLWIFDTVSGVGSLFGYLVLGGFATRIGLKRLLYGSLFGAGIFQIIFALLSDWKPALVVTFLISAVSGALTIVCTALFIGEMPQSLVGRISSVSGTLTTIVSAVATALGGFLASVVLVRLTWHILGMTLSAFNIMYIGASISLFGAGLYIVIALRDVTIEPSTASKVREEGEEVRIPVTVGAAYRENPTSDQVREDVLRQSLVKAKGDEA